MTEPDFSLPDPQRAEFEKRYKGLKPPRFDNGDVTECRPMTRVELQQYRQYRASQGRSLPNPEDYQQPF
jgi:hypothetical protein